MIEPTHIKGFLLDYIYIYEGPSSKLIKKIKFDQFLKRSIKGLIISSFEVGGQVAYFEDQEEAKTLMRRGSRKMWRVVVPCTRKKSKQTESRMDIEEILKMKLATITEEPKTIEENGGLLTSKHRTLSSSSCMTKMGKKKNQLIKVKMGRLSMPQFSLKESYLIFMTGLALKGGFHGLPRC